MVAPTFAAIVVALGVTASLTAADADEREARYTWLSATMEFRHAGELIGHKKFDEAKLHLEGCVAQFAGPYRKIATDQLRELRDARQPQHTLNGYYQLGKLGSVCGELGAHDAAIGYYRRAHEANPKDHYTYWLTAIRERRRAGDPKGALAEFEELDAERRAYASGIIDQLRRQVDELDKAGDDPALLRAYVIRNHRNWAARLGKLAELLPRVRDDALRVRVYRDIRDTLVELGDATGGEAWERRILKEYAHDAVVVASVHLERAERAYKSGDHDAAVQTWRMIDEKYRSTPSWASAVGNIGLHYRTLDRTDAALAELKRLPAGGGFKHVVPLEQWGADVNWIIGLCHLDVGDYAAALAAFRTSHIGAGSGCGNAYAEAGSTKAMYIGLCLEGLGRYDEAVRAYFGAAVGTGGLYHNAEANVRLMDLYAATDQVDDLSAIVHTHESRLIEHQTLAGVDIKDALRYLPTRTLREILEMHECAGGGRWDKLIALLRNENTTIGPHEHDRREWRARRAAGLLAAAADETAPLLIAAMPEAAKRLGRNDGPDVRWIYYTLGRCGTDEALAALERRLSPPPNSWSRVVSLVYGVAQTGEPGDKLLRRLAERYPDSRELRDVIGRHVSGTLERKSKPAPPFPALPKRGTVTLPKQMMLRIQ